ncbi:MAG: hypothetical protein K0S47_2525 [Herbinix sp.]|nr:hypothetical protein [Herbinix sp.]
MADVKPFFCIRPDQRVAARVAALPYDVYNRNEALQEVVREPLSFLKIDRAETQFDEQVDTYNPIVYQKARELLIEMLQEKILIEDSQECYYIYELTMEQRSQTGIVACCSIDDYINNTIKKHENTREDKEIDRIHHVDVCNAQTGPIFLTYRSLQSVDEIVAESQKEEALYDFTSKDGISHRVWRITDHGKVETLQSSFSTVSNIYIADGHHRAASAVKVGLKRRAENPKHTGKEEYNYFLSVLFPHDQLLIMSYNRAVKDLNGLSKSEFIDKIKESFLVECLGQSPFAPMEKACFGMYLEDEWYCLKAKDVIRSVKDPVAALDVSILQNYLLKPILGIEDPRTDKRIDFIGGIRGLSELERRGKEDMKVAFSMYPTSITELFDVSDAGNLMPPKSTWFEPKLRSGIFIHPLS